MAGVNSWAIYGYNIPVPQWTQYSNSAPSQEFLPIVVLDKLLVIPIYSSHVFFNHREANQPGNILDPLSKIAKSRTSVHAILVGIDVALNFAGIRH